MSSLQQRLPLLMPTLAWVLGIALARAEGMSYTVLWWVAACCVLCIAVLRHRYFFVPLLLGICWGSASFIYDVYRISYDDTWLQPHLSVQATVLDVQYHPASARIRLGQVHQTIGHQSLHGFVDVYLYGKKPPSIGQTIQTLVHVHPPRNHHNPAGFDYEAYALERHIALVGSIKASWQMLDDAPSILEQARVRIQAALPQDKATRGILEALLLATRSGIPIAIQDAFAATGTAHVLAISGLHVGMVAAWGAFLAFFILTRREAWMVSLPVPRMALACGVVLAAAYATLAQWPLPTQRALIMLLFACLAWFWRARYSAINTLCLGLICMVLWQPSAVFSVSLWLSFLATLSLLLWLEGGKQGSVRQAVVGLLQVSIVATVATLPLIVTVFGLLPVWTLPVNLCLVPLYAFVVLPLALLGEIAAVLHAHELATWLMQTSAWGIELGNQGLLWVEHMWGGRVHVAAPPWWWHLVYGVLLVWLAKYWRGARRMLGFVLILVLYGVLLVVQPSHVRKDVWTAWDVGQGAATTYVQAMPDGSTHVLVVDVPGRAGSRFNGGTTVASGLRSMGITHVDVLLLSHAQSDHDGGAFRLLASVNHVRALWLADVPNNHHNRTMRAIIHAVQVQGGVIRWLQQGDVLPLGGATVQVLWPPRGFAPNNANNTSLVCSVGLANGKKVLLAGDMERQVERALDGQWQAYDMMMLPHHGSKTSSTAAFVRAVQPKIAIAQTGYHNHFGFPKAAVVQRYQAVGAQIYNTADGAVSWSPDEQKAKIYVDDGKKHQKKNAALQWLQLFL